VAPEGTTDPGAWERDRRRPEAATAMIPPPAAPNNPHGRPAGRKGNPNAEAARVSYRKKFQVEPDTKVDLSTFDPSAHGTFVHKADAAAELARLRDRLSGLQYLLYAEGSQSLLVVLQAMDAGGKDGTVRHVFDGLDPQGVQVHAFKQPTPEELAHDFLWRIHAATPRKGEITIFNRSHYEDVLVVRVHDLVPKDVWSKRYARIVAFEKNLVKSGTHILKFFLHISPEEQLARFKERLEDPQRQWKISESDYTERAYWDDYMHAYEAALEKTSTKHAPWFVIPADHKWYRDLAVSAIIVETLEALDMKVPPAHVDLADIARRYHAADANPDPATPTD
jgi:PPK2 family polyphosphate:nucleotide phosphotransferase